MALTGVGSFVLAYILFFKRTLRKAEGNKYKEIYIHSSEMKNDNLDRIYEVIDYFILDGIEYLMVKCISQVDNSPKVVRVCSNGYYIIENENLREALEFFEKRKMNEICII